MANNTKIFKLQGKVQHYTWGGMDFIPALLHLSNSDKKPFAEYWMGAHDNVPAEVVLPDGSLQPLNAFIKQDAVALLGNSVHQRFGRLPYLLKVLDVKDMLSIQVHPTKAAAVSAFAAENMKGTPLNAPNRNYKDDNHKPELMLALSNFWLLHGFKSPQALVSILMQTPELQFLVPVFNNKNYHALYEMVMTMDQIEVDEHLRPLLDRIVPLYEKGFLNRSQEDFWAARAAKTFCEPNKIDRGIFSIYLFNLVKLQPGEAIFQDAGIPHAYLEGQNMEIMANSDNVLRGGLTNKYIDVPELMHHTKFEAVIPDIIKGTAGAVAVETVFPTPAADFELRKLELKTGSPVSLTAATAEIYFVYEGAVKATDGQREISLRKGEALLSTAGAAFELQPSHDAVVFRATVPQ
ncbi:mannose-6-phosphate isomerase, class I [Niastella caeni]|uniref:mannose-6-phosphate isomerase n=1 Tax=Niastella caeni TaxID=2569763 RepID=A0A4S8I0F5_9BACT|nr:mannose-6-phosphate isomerase, class I [Niastella caeni]THU40639.1 mannose-6-phosphate isomerase, class I [Niastella caeni]